MCQRNILKLPIKTHTCRLFVVCSKSKLPTAELNDVNAKFEKEKKALVSSSSEMAAILAEEKLRRKLEVRRLKKSCKRLAQRARGVGQDPRSGKKRKLDESQEFSESRGANTGLSDRTADSGGSVEVGEDGVAGASSENEEKRPRRPSASGCA